MRLLFVVALVTALGLSACATEGKYKEALNTWIGHTEAELVAKWGPPLRVHQVPNGPRILTYLRSNTYYLPGTPSTYQSTVTGNTITTTKTGGVAPSEFTLSCVTNFYITNGRITNWRFEGSDCVSR